MIQKTFKSRLVNNRPFYLLIDKYGSSIRTTSFYRRLNGHLVKQAIKEKHYAATSESQDSPNTKIDSQKDTTRVDPFAKLKSKLVSNVDVRGPSGPWLLMGKSLKQYAEQSTNRRLVYTAELARRKDFKDSGNRTAVATSLRRQRNLFSNLAVAKSINKLAVYIKQSGRPSSQKIGDLGPEFQKIINNWDSLEKTLDVSKNTGKNRNFSSNQTTKKFSK
jgi:hypothetical protein